MNYKALKASKDFEVIANIQQSVDLLLVIQQSQPEGDSVSLEELKEYMQSLSDNENGIESELDKHSQLLSAYPSEKA